MNILYYDCFAGISGDMHLAALLDLGLDCDELILELAKLGLDGYGVQAHRASRKGITGTQVRVVVDPRQPDYRNLRQVEALIGQSLLADAVQRRAIGVFRRLAEAEARIHDTSPDSIHLNEVGGVDAIVDIVGSAIALERLNVDRVLCSPVELGSGMVQCEDGFLSVPAPVTLELLKGIPVRLGTVPFEATTPTGAALLAAFVDEFVSRPTFAVDRVGYGVGQLDGPVSNVLRVCLGTQAETEDQDELWMLECNIDDMNPECYDHVLERLSAAGALEAWLTPVQMRKNRPGMLLSVLCLPPRILDLSQLLFVETTTLGVRDYPVRRTALIREVIPVATRYGEVAAQVAWFQGRPLRSKPDYEDCKRLALQHGISLQRMYVAVQAVLDSAYTVWQDT